MVRRATVRFTGARPKYGNRKVRFYGMLFDSVKEAERYLELLSWQKQGRISGLERQVAFELVPPQKDGKVRAVKYIADFVYKQDGKTVVEDTKGYRTEVYRLKKKLMLWVHGIEIEEV